MKFLSKLLLSAGLGFSAMAGTVKVTYFEMSPAQAETNRLGDLAYYYCGNVTGLAQTGCSICYDGIGWVYLDDCSGQNSDANKNKSNEATSQVSTGASVNNNFFAYNQTVNDSDFGGSGFKDGCKPCGGGSAGASGLKDMGFKRHLDARKPHAPGDFGVGSSSSYDYKLKLHTIGSALIADLDGPGLNFSMRLVDGRNGDVKDGAFNDQLNASVDEMQLLDVNGNLTTDITQAVTADLYNRSRELMRFEIFQIGSDYYGRITEVKDRNGYGMDIAYKTWTATEIAASPERQWQRDTVTNANGRVTTFTYDPTMIAGGYVISSVTLPNGQQVSYSYNQDTLSTVTYPDSSQSTYSYSVGAGNFTELSISEVNGETKKVYMSSNITGTIVGGTGINPEGVSVWNQASMLAKTVEVNNEVRYHYTGNPNRENDRLIYEGRGVVKRIHNGNHRRYGEGNITTPDTGAWTYTNTTIAGESKYAFWPGAPTNLFINAPVKLFDDQRREYDYEYVDRNSLSKKTYTDSTFEEWEYNSFRQVTRYRDRLGRVTKYSYDSRGNQLSKEVGILDVGGVDTNTAEYAVYNKEYYPSGHANEFLLRYEFDANNNRTEYIYNSDDQLTQINEPDDAGTGYHAASTFTYDSNKRLATSTDAVGRTTTYSYDDRERVTKITYHDTSTELFIYGTGSQSDKIVKKKDRNGNTTRMTYDGAGRTIETITAYSTMDKDGNNEVVLPTATQSVETCTYLNGTDVKFSCTVDGDLTTYMYDYRRRLTDIKKYPDDNSILITKRRYVDNLLFRTEDSHGRNTYYDYRTSDSAMIRKIQGLTTSYSERNFTKIMPKARDLSNNADYLITDYELDAEGQVTATVDPRGIRYETTYDSRGRVTFQVNAHGTTVASTTENIYDANSNVIEVRSPRYFSESINARTTSTYGRRNMLASRTVAPGSTVAATESFTYYDDGRAKDHTDFRGNTSTTVWHQCCGRLQANIDQAGHQRVSNNDFYSNVTHTAVVDAAGTISNYHDLPDAATVQEVTTRFDSRHRPVATTVWLDPLGLVDPNNVPIAGDAGVTQNGLTTTYTYYDETTGHAELAPLLTELANDGITFGANNGGAAVISINPEGEVSVSIQDGMGRTVATGMYDKTDWANSIYTLVTWNTTIHDTITNDLLETRSISALNHVNKVLSDGAGRTLQTEDAEGKQSNFFYDANSNLVKIRDANSVGQDCVFDELNRDIQCTDTQGDVTKTEYDLNNNVTKRTDAKLNDTVCAFDERNRKTSCTDRLSGNTTYGYDANSNLTSITDALSKVTSYEFDIRNLQTKVTYADAGITQCSYDALRRKSVCTDQLTDTVTYNYDLASRLLTREYHLTGSTLESTDTFTYDDASRVLTAHKGRYNNTCTYTYDEIGRRETEKLTVGANNYTVTHTYDADNRITNCAYPAGNNIAKTWTDRNQLLSIDFNAGDIADFTYDNGMREATRTFGNTLVTTQAYRSDNTKSSISIAGKNDLSFTYSYDVNKNVTAETSTGTAMSGYSFTAGFDNEDRVTSWSRTNTDSQAWTLDLIGNWSNTTGSLGGSSFNETRTHNDVHELTDIAGNTVSYDAKGNMTTDANGNTLLWDIDNHLTSFSDGVNTTNFTYDALGRRVEKGDTLFVCDGQRVIEEYQDNGSGYALARSYVYGSYIDDVLAKVEAGALPTVNYYHSDRQFNVRGLTDSSGNIVELYAYSVYGKQTVMDNAGTTLAGTLQNNYYGFTGRYLDSACGLWYFRARYFSDEMGRFISRDPLGYVDGMGLYNGYFAQRFGLDPNGKSKLTYLCNPADSVRTFNCTGYGASAAKKIADIPGPSGHNDAEDALRHCITMCCAAKKIGSTEAVKIGDAHEAGTVKVEAKMDKHNNRMGAIVAANQGSNCALNCLRLLNGGALLIIENGKTVPSKRIVQRGKAETYDEYDGYEDGTYYSKKCCKKKNEDKK